MGGSGQIFSTLGESEVKVIPRVYFYRTARLRKWFLMNILLGSFMTDGYFLLGLAAGKEMPDLKSSQGDVSTSRGCLKKLGIPFLC